MTGLEKITGKILAEANADAEKILAEAKVKCDAISAEYRQRADALREKLAADARKEGEEIVTRAKSGAAMDERNILLGAKADVLDDTFSEAYQALRNLPEEEYVELLVTLLADTLVAGIDQRKRNLMLYGEEEITEEPESYEVLLNAKDREQYGQKVLAGVRRAVVGKVDPVVLDKLILSAKTARIDGGVILRYGDIESNCSLEMVFANARERLEAEVSRMLFD